MKRLMITLSAIMLLTIGNVSNTGSMTLKKEYDKVEIGNSVVFVEKRDHKMSNDVVKQLLPEVKRKPLKIRISANFKHKIAMLESGDRYDIESKLGYLGKYQFSKKTLRALVERGFLEATPEDLANFKLSPELQEKAMEALIVCNTKVLKNYKLDKYIGTEIGGVMITMDGLLAASHLVGPYAVKHFLLSGGSLEPVVVKGVTVRMIDANGTKITDYLAKFA